MINNAIFLKEAKGRLFDMQIVTAMRLAANKLRAPSCKHTNTAHSLSPRIEREKMRRHTRRRAFFIYCYLCEPFFCSRTLCDDVDCFFFPDGCESKQCEYYAVCESDGAGNSKCVCPQSCADVSIYWHECGSGPPQNSGLHPI